MKYYEVEMTITPCSQDARDILSALSAEAGFETFEETPTGLLAYVQQSLFDREASDNAIADFPFEGIHKSYAEFEQNWLRTADPEPPSDGDTIEIAGRLAAKYDSKI